MNLKRLNQFYVCVFAGGGGHLRSLKKSILRLKLGNSTSNLEISSRLPSQY